jgi:hypothetical protein
MAQDSFLDDEFAPLDTRKSPEHFAQALADIGNEENSEIPFVEDTPPATVDVAAPPAVEEEPEVMDMGDGAEGTIRKISGGYEAILDPGTGRNPERFTGKTYKEIVRALMIGKVHATKLIGTLQQEKNDLRAQKVQPVETPAPTPEPTNVLSADDEVQMKLDFATNPARAVEKWFTKRLGLSPDEAAKDLRAGKQAKIDLTEEQHARNFIAKHPEYINYDHNRDRMFAYLRVHNLPLTEENLTKAYNDLVEVGRIDFTPLQVEEPEEVPEVPAARATVAVAPAAPSTPPTPPQRIAEPRRQLASTGLHRRDVTVTPAPASTELQTADELDNLTDDEIAQLFTGVRRHAAQTRR